MSSARPFDDRGTVTIAGLGCLVALLFLGGISIDLWRVLGTRRQLAAVAEASALGGADGVDLDHMRTTGELILDPPSAERRALLVVGEQATDLTLTDPPVVSVQNREVTVQLTTVVEFGLIRILLGPGNVEVVVESSARPRLLD